ncbi:MAG: methyltransferase domain-containing protein, partial [bacterium]
MPIIDKSNILDRLKSMDKVIVELGCGKRKRNPNWIGIDTLDFEGVDIVGDVFAVLEEFPDHSIDCVHSFHFFEHVADLKKLLDELARVMKSNRQIEIVVPHFSNPHFYSDYTHKQFFGLYSFSYLAEDNLLRRRVPQYIGRTSFELLKVDLIFKSSPPFYGRHAFKKAIGFFFNMNTYMKELYEETFCYL